MPTLPVGARCLYYPSTDGGDPICADVMHSNPEGILELALTRWLSRDHDFRRTVRYRFNPEVQKNPLRAGYQQGTDMGGVWDYVPAYGPEPPVSVHPSLAKVSTQLCTGPVPLRTPQEITAKLEELSAPGMLNATDMAQVMSQFTGEEWNYQKVNQFLIRMKKAAEAEKVE